MVLTVHGMAWYTTRDTTGPGEDVHLDDVAVWNMTWREKGPLRRGREKLIINTRTASYISVHVVTTGSKMKVADSESELRLK